MSDLKIDTAGLTEAGNAASTAGTTLADTVARFTAPSQLADSAFTSQGSKVASWYEQQRTDMLKVLENSQNSYADLAKVFTTSGALMVKLDEMLAKKATHHGGE